MVIGGGSAKRTNAGSSKRRRSQTRASPRSRAAMASLGAFYADGSRSWPRRCSSRYRSPMRVRRPVWRRLTRSACHDVASSGREGALGLLWSHIENKKLLAFVDQSAKFIDADTVHAKLTDKRLPPPPSCQQIQAKRGHDS